jgi:hypothetical protein
MARLVVHALRVAQGKLKLAVASFTAAPAKLERAGPAADEARLSKRFAHVKAESELFANVGKKLKAGDKAGAEHIVVRLTQNANRANLQILPFDFRYCRLEPGRFT